MAAHAGEFGGGDEFLPIVGAARYQTQQVFGADNGVGIGFGIAVYGGEKYHAVGLHQFGAGSDDGGGVGYVFQQFHAGNHIEGVRHFFGQLFHSDVAVADVADIFFQGVQFGDFQGFFRHIDAGNCVGTELGHALGKNAAATADVQYGFAGQTGVAVDIAQAQRVDVVQGFEFAGFVPPFVGKAAEFVDFGGVYVGAIVCFGIHDDLVGF